MTSFVHVDHPTQHPGVVRAERVADSVKSLAGRLDGTRAIATLLLAAIVAAAAGGRQRGRRHLDRRPPAGGLDRDVDRGLRRPGAAGRARPRAAAALRAGLKAWAAAATPGRPGREALERGADRRPRDGRHQPRHERRRAHATSGATTEGEGAMAALAPSSWLTQALRPAADAAAQGRWMPGPMRMAQKRAQQRRLSGPARHARQRLSTTSSSPGGIDRRRQEKATDRGGFFRWRWSIRPPGASRSPPWSRSVRAAGGTPAAGTARCAAAAPSPRPPCRCW